MTSITPPGLLNRLLTTAKWEGMGFTTAEALRHQAEIDRIMGELRNDHEWRITASREEMEQPTRVRDYMAQAYAELHDREWRENLHAYLDDIALNRTGGVR